MTFWKCSGFNVILKTSLPAAPLELLVAPRLGATVLNQNLNLHPRAVLSRIRIFGVSDPDFWRIFGPGAGLDIIFAEAGSGYGLSKTLRLEHFLFFHVLIFSCKIFLITWDLRDLMLDDGFMLLCNLPRTVDFAVHITVVTCVAPTLIVCLLAEAWSLSRT